MLWPVRRPPAPALSVQVAGWAAQTSDEVTMVQTLPEALERQALACTDLGSPFTAAVLRAFAHLWQAEQVPPALAARLQAFSGDIGPSGHSLPLRLAGALHALHLRGRAGPLTPAYNAPQGRAPADLIAPMAAVLQTEAAFVDHYLDSPPQTNEMRRSGPLIALGQWLTARFGLPLVLSELGASAGLNLIWDRYALDLRGESFGAADPVARLAPDWQGALPPVAQPRVVARAGADLNPLDPVADRLRLLSYIWADQADRLARTRAGLDALSADPAPVARADAADWLEARLAVPHPGALHLVCHTVAWQYFPPAVQARCAAALARAGAAASATAPLAHFGMEADGAAPGAALRLTLWPGGETLDLGRADFHGRWVDWRAPAP